MLAILRNSIFLILFLFSDLTGASVEFKVGDVLLQPLKCWACSLIEAEEETIYSHVGLVISLRPLTVAEAFGSVRAISLSDFNFKTEAGQKIRILRFRNENLVYHLQSQQKGLFKMFREDFEGRKYDHDFRWNNFDENGEEKFYCSEFVSKLLQGFAGIELPIKRMHFQRNRESWVTYFRGNIPDNEWGNSPGDFERSDLFWSVGEL